MTSSFDKETIDKQVTDKPATLIGIVGYSAIMDSYPLGPPLMTGLETALADAPSVTIENFTWSPVHIVQRFENDEMPKPERMVLIGLSATTINPGNVTACQWRGGKASELTVQERVYEAVTGIVDLENTLMIGEYFKAWPTECFTIEADMQPNTFGRLVMADSEGWGADEKALEEHFGFSPAEQRQRIISMAENIARHGENTSQTLHEKSAETLTPVQPFIENHAVSQKG